MANQRCSCKQHGLIFLLLVLFLQRRLDTSVAVASAAGWQPMQCDAVSMNPTSCSSSFLYATSEGRRSLTEIAVVFNATASTSLLRPIKRPSGAVDVLVTVPCTCEVLNSTMSALFHDTRYVVRTGDTSDSVNREIFSGLAMSFGDGSAMISGDTITVHLPCGCSTATSKGVVSYAVQEEDTLPQIASLFRSTSQDILNLNPGLTNPDFVKPGWILFVPIGLE